MKGEQMANFSDFRQAGKYLTHQDVPQPMVATILKFEQKDEKKYRSEETERRLVVYFTEFGSDQYLKLTNTQLDDLGSMFGSIEAATGQQVVLMTTNIDVGGQQRQTLKISPHIQAQAQQPTQPNRTNATNQWRISGTNAGATSTARGTI